MAGGSTNGAARFLGHPRIRDLLSLGLARADFALAGSVPIFARGWIDDPGDIDVVARGAAWRQVTGLGEVWVKPATGVRRVRLFGGAVEVFDGWFPFRWPVDRLIDEADTVQGVRCVRLDVVVATKRSLARQRDRQHLQIIAEHLPGLPVPLDPALPEGIRDDRWTGAFVIDDGARA